MRTQNFSLGSQMDPFRKPKATKLLCQLLLGSEPGPARSALRLHLLAQGCGRVDACLKQTLGVHMYIAHTYLYLHISSFITIDYKNWWLT